MTEKQFTLEERVKEIEYDLKHIKLKIDAIFAILYKAEKDGLKVKVIK